MDTKILSTKSTKKVTHSSRNDKVRKLEEELTRQFNEMKRLTRAGKIKEWDKLIKKIHVTN